MKVDKMEARTVEMLDELKAESLVGMTAATRVVMKVE
jgi:hypothetical protein